MATIRTDAVSRRPDFSWPTQMLLSLAATAALVTVFYFFIDQPVISFFHDHGQGQRTLLKGLTRPPEAFVVLSPCVLLAGLLRRWFTPGPGSRRWPWPLPSARCSPPSPLCS